MKNNYETTKEFFRNIKIDFWDKDIENIGVRKWRKTLNSLFDTGDYLIKYKNKFYVLEFINDEFLEFYLYSLNSYLNKYGIDEDEFLEDKEIL